MYVKYCLHIAGRTPGLKTLKLGGAYRLTDVALAGIVDNGF